MKFLLNFFRRKPRPAEPFVQHESDRVTLNEVLDLENHALPPADYPLGLTPIAHSLPRLDPHANNLREIVSGVAHNLHIAGATDSLTSEVLHNWIDAWHETWVAKVLDDAESRRVVAARLVSITNANLEREKLELDHLKRKYIDATADHTAFSTYLGLGHSASPDLNETALAAEVKQADDDSVVADLLPFHSSLGGEQHPRLLP
ncbi:hypothetical protein E3T37_00675 [Cryobacterium sp. TMT2-10]|uniref:hypothetical protein n=1 Tax=Cryobacterium sp. TMT2-10 TaxID=1259244 RepID=UPI00106A5B38|nr:hypothetical protein [Cryobacterium sp. TMT2-10]TFD43813.1 hypothetical protein E3T37_00675 [Cryobacterium sp. TMT2-10]